MQLFQITETFEMETQPQLLLLQKTMVTAEGVAQSLNPDINFWESAEPTVAHWMRENMGIEAQAADVVKDGIALMRKIPAIVTRADDLLSEMEAREKARADLMELEESAAQQRRIRGGYLLGGVVLGAIAAYLVVLAT